MVCSICKKPGHNKKGCSEKLSIVSEVQEAPKPSIVSGVQEEPKPSTHDGYWIRHGTEHNGITGKWMLFYSKAVIDKQWEHFKGLYDSKKLTGIRLMKVSGAKENFRASNKNEAVIILYCGGKEEEIMKAGVTVASYVHDYAGPYIYYKTDIQTGMGTQATGATTNHTFRVKVAQRTCLLSDV